jgi:hypothetical protein
MSEPLYELTGDLVEFQKLIEKEELPEEAIKDTLDSLQMAFDDKAVAVVQVSRGMDYSVEALDKEIARLQARKKVITNRQGRLEEYLRSNMETSGTNKIECPYFTITLAQAADQLEIVDADAIPDEYLEVKTELKPKKKDLLDALKKIRDAREALKDNPGALAAIDDIPGVRLAKGKRSLRIK